MKATERRSHPRANTDLGMRVQGQPSPARVRNISASGVSCVTDQPLPLLTQVQLVLLIPARPAHRTDGTNAPPGTKESHTRELPTREIVCRGAVVRSEPLPSRASAAAATNSASTATTRSDTGKRASQQYDTAIFFTDMKDSDRAEVEEMVAAALRKGS